MYAMQERILYGEPSPSPHFFFDSCTGLNQVWRLSVGRQVCGARRWRYELAAKKWIGIRRVGNVDLADMHAVQKQDILCDGPRQTVIEDPGSRPNYSSFDFSWRKCQGEPGSKILAVVQCVLPVVPQPKRDAEVWQHAHRVLAKSAGLLRKERNIRIALVDLEQIGTAYVVLSDIRVLSAVAKLENPSEVCSIENVPPVVPRRSPKKEAVLSANVCRGVLNIKPSPLFAIIGLGGSTGEDAADQNLWPARRAS